MKYDLLICDKAGATGKPVRYIANSLQRDRISDLIMWVDLGKETGKDKEEVFQEYVNRKKRIIRTEYRNHRKNEIAIRNDFDTCILKIDVGEVSLFSKNQIKHICADMWMERTYSLYDCTGKFFTNWIRYKVLHNHWIIYHSYSIDV